MENKHLKITTAYGECEIVTYLLDNSPDYAQYKKRPLVVICPGGGYAYTSDREAEPIAIAMNARDYNAVILRYTVDEGSYPAAISELAATVKYARQHAGQWHIDPDEIIVMGFSAGGHVAASLGVFWHSDILQSMGYDPLEIQPNYLILNYPVITSGKHGHHPSFDQLLGADKQDLLPLMSLENQVTHDVPPTFIWATYEDNAVPVDNTLLFANSLRYAKVPFEMHIFEKGAHGLSLGSQITTAPSKEIQRNVMPWLDLAMTWLSMRGVIPKNPEK